MPRRARVTLPNVPHHIIHSGCFYIDKDYTLYLLQRRRSRTTALGTILTPDT